MNKPTVTIVFPCRDREWILPYFLECVYNLDYPKELINIFTIVNDSSDKSLTMLNDFKFKHMNKYNKITIKSMNYGTPIYDEKRHNQKVLNTYIHPNGTRTNKLIDPFKEVYKNLGRLRNSLLHNANTDYIFSVDTDILFDSHTLVRLLESDREYISAFICNGYVVGMNDDKRAYDYSNALILKDGKYKHLEFDKEHGGIVEVDNTGAISIMSKSVYKSGAKYDYHIDGEDAYFAEQVKNKGFKIYCDTSLKCSHMMNRYLLNKYLNKGWKW
jgi:glycosyltransferase involved in cell wall biosynthesis